MYTHNSASYMITGTQSMRAYEEAKRFMSPTPANCPAALFKRNSKGNIQGVSQNDIKVKQNDAFLFYVDEEPLEGVSVNFTPNGISLRN